MVEAKKIDSANSIIESIIENQELEAKKEKIAKNIAKTAKIQGFRPGKVPVKLVKKMYSTQIEHDAVSEAIQDALNEGLKKLDIKDLIAEPEVTKFEKKEEKIEIEIKVATRPEININDEYKECVPEIEKPQVSDEEVEKELEQIAKSFAESKISQKETLEKGDIAVIDFTGYIDGEKMENGSAEAYPLEIGSNQFIPGFEEQLIGMKVGESNKIKVTFPEDYHAKELAGKEAEFEVTLQEIQEKVPAEINDELAKKYLNNGASGLLSFEVKDYQTAIKIANSTEVFSIVVNIGDSKSIITHPASTTHQQLTKDELKEANISEGLIRLSIGLEDVDDLIDDLNKALR